MALLCVGPVSKADTYNKGREPAEAARGAVQLLQAEKAG